MKISDEEAAQILTVGQAVDFVLASAGATIAARSTATRGQTWDRGATSSQPTAATGVGDALRAARRAAGGSGGRVFTHASWTRRSESYERLAFLGDSVLELAITTHLYPRLEADRFGAGPADEDPRPGGVGPLVPRRRRAARGAERLLAAAPEAVARHRAGADRDRACAGIGDRGGDRRLLSAFGYDRAAAAVVEAFAPEIEEALERPVDFKSALQERLARRGEIVRYAVVDETGPPHDRTFTVSARIGGDEIGPGSGEPRRTPSRRRHGRPWRRSRREVGRGIGGRPCT